MVVHDINPTAATTLLESGAVWADSPRVVARSSDVVITSLPGPDEVRAVALGNHGIVEGSHDGMIYVDTSTGSAVLLREIEAQFAPKGATVLDAPVSGGVAGAENGTLAVMVGGSADGFSAVLPLLESIGNSITYVGPVGTGTIAKLVHNAISMSTRIAVQEGLALAVKAGVRPETMLEVLLNGSFGQQLVLTSHIPDLLFSGDFEHPRFSLGLSYKDVGLALELAEESSGVSRWLSSLTGISKKRWTEVGESSTTWSPCGCLKSG